MDVGFIGLGNQGAPIAARILAAGFPLHVWARRPDATAELAAAGAKVHATPRDLAAACGVVGLCVRGDDDVDEVLRAGPDSLIHALQPGSIVMVHATVLPETVKQLAAFTAGHRVHLLDAPVSGGPGGAMRGTMSVMVGGEVAVLERVRPVLASFASNIFLLGPVGCGQLIKLINNNVCFANMGVGIAALDVAERLGIDRDAASRVILESSGASRGLATILDIFAQYGRMRPNSNMPKDHAHLLDVMRERGIAQDLLADTAKRATALIDDYREPA